MAAYCKPCQAFHDIDAPHTRPQPLPKADAYVAPELKKPKPVLNATCSFCGEKSKKVVAGPAIYICVDCVALCADIIGYVPPGYVPEESVRYNVRIKLLEERLARAVWILKGEP